jgi:hypothetical protein
VTSVVHFTRRGTDSAAEELIPTGGRTDSMQDLCAAQADIREHIVIEFHQLIDVAANQALMPDPGELSPG